MAIIHILLIVTHLCALLVSVVYSKHPHNGATGALTTVL